MPNPLFSSYRAGENRVTSSTLAVFERIDLALVTELLATATGTSDSLRSVTFTNQIAGSGSVPDAEISARFTWWFETKTTRSAYDGVSARRQVRLHAEALRDRPGAMLFVLTPDAVRPAWFERPDGIAEGVDVLWVGFRDLSDAIRQVVADPQRVLAEQTRFLLSELDALYEADGLLSNDDTVVVAARDAWPEYPHLKAYICQPDRHFRRDATHMGFYADGAIQALVPRIERYLPSVLFTHDEARRWRQRGGARVADLVDRLLDSKRRENGEAYGIVLLTGPDDPATEHLPTVIKNDTRSSSGRRSAWTQWQRYTRLDRLTSGVRSTSEL